MYRQYYTLILLKNIALHVFVNVQTVLQLHVLYTELVVAVKLAIEELPI